MRLKLTGLLSVVYRRIQHVVLIEHCTIFYRLNSYKYFTDQCQYINLQSVPIDIEGMKFWLIIVQTQNRSVTQRERAQY